MTPLEIERLSHTDMPPQIRSLVLAEGLDREIGLGFRLAHEALGSRIKRVVSSVYDLDPSVHGTFDLVHSGDLLLHLERPLDALRAIRSVTGGRAMISDSYLPLPSDSQGQHLVQYFGGWWSSTWWLPSLDALAQMILDAGFSDVRVHRIYNLAAADESAGFWRAVLIANP